MTNLTPDQKVELLPCPFCGSADLGDPNFECDYGVQCNNCGAMHGHEDRDEAIRLWNTRTATLPAPVEQGKGKGHEPIKRYSHLTNGTIGVATNGEWVLYEDHLTAPSTQDALDARRLDWVLKNGLPTKLLNAVGRFVFHYSESDFYYTQREAIIAAMCATESSKGD
jgi:Lar family restriction alleviation protein